MRTSMHIGHNYKLSQGNWNGAEGRLGRLVVSLHHEAKQPLVKWLCSKTTVSGGFTDPRVTSNHVIPANYPIFLWCFTIICVFMTSWEQHFYIIIRESWHRVTYTNAEFFCKSTVRHKSGYRKTESTLTLHTSCYLLCERSHFKDLKLKISVHVSKWDLSGLHLLCGNHRIRCRD